MKRKMTVGLVSAFVGIAGSALVGAYCLSGTQTGKSAQCMANEIAGIAYTTETILDCTESPAKKTETGSKTAIKKTKVNEAGLSGKNPSIANPSKEKKSESEETGSDAKVKSEPTTEWTQKQTEAATEEPTTAAPNIEETTADPTTEDKRITTETPGTTEAEKEPKRTTEKSTEVTTEATTEAKRVWHPEVTEKVWVVDEEAWSETITYTDYIDCYKCTSCGAVFSTYDEGYIHLDESLARHTRGEIGLEQVCNSFKTWQKPVEKTETFDYPEKGHWETRVVSEGYWE